MKPTSYGRYANKELESNRHDWVGFLGLWLNSFITRLKKPTKDKYILIGLYIPKLINIMEWITGFFEYW